jgi:hypothetical protein
MMVAFTNEQAEALLNRLVAAFNVGARTGDFGAYVALFTDDATIDFEGIPERGPIVGRDAIAARYREDPPDDEIRVTRWKVKDDTISAEFVWNDAPEALGGCFFAEPQADLIARLTIAIGGPRCRFR